MGCDYYESDAQVGGGRQVCAVAASAEHLSQHPSSRACRARVLPRTPVATPRPAASRIPAAPNPPPQREALIKAGGVPMGIGSGSTVGAGCPELCMVELACGLRARSKAATRGACSARCEGCHHPATGRTSHLVLTPYHHPLMLARLPQLRNVIVDKNARIGDNVQIINKCVNRSLAGCVCGRGCSPVCVWWLGNEAAIRWLASRGWLSAGFHASTTNVRLTWIWVHPLCVATGRACRRRHVRMRASSSAGALWAGIWDWTAPLSTGMRLLSRRPAHRAVQERTCLRNPITGTNRPC